MESNSEDMTDEVIGCLVNYLLSSINPEDVLELHNIVDITRSNTITINLAEYYNLPQQTKSALRNAIHRICPGASDAVVGAICLAWRNQNNISVEYLRGVNIICPLPTIQAMQADIAALQHTVTANHAELQNTVAAMHADLINVINLIQQNP